MESNAYFSSGFLSEQMISFIWAAEDKSFEQQ